MKYSHIICHYSEIGLKGRNRPYFVKILRDNIKLAVNKIDKCPIEKIQIIHDRILIILSDYNDITLQQIKKSLSNIFGIAYFCPAIKINDGLDSIKTNALSILKEESFESFRITARMSTPSTLSKMYVHEKVGEYIQKKLKKSVSLKFPDINCYIDSFSAGTFIYTDKIKGSGGMPVSTGGKGIVMLSGGIDSPVAAYYLLKRGMSLSFVHFHSIPHVSPASIEKVKELTLNLSKYQKKSKLLLVPFSEIQEEIVSKTSEKYRVLLYRRMMLKISNEIAHTERGKAIITGEALGQVSSQTLENIASVDCVSSLPVFRPLIGMDKQEIINTGKLIETYDISIRPHEDCCTLFLPERPATKSTAISLEREENKFNYSEMIKNAIDKIEIVEF